MVAEYYDKGKLKIAHLTANYDPNLDRLVYNRKLIDGPGSSQYGLEVCKSLNIERSFIELANNIRRELDDIPDMFHSIKTSKYCNKIYVDSCQMCGSKKKLQTHHIREQKEADKKGYINYYHKNTSFNLLVLCEDCHQNSIHKENIKLIPKDTLEGTYLIPQVL